MGLPPAVNDPVEQLLPSHLHLPAGAWTTVLECLCEHFPQVPPEQWLARMQRGLVQDTAGQPLPPAHPYREGLRVRYFREIIDEPPLPVLEQVLYQDRHLLVVDKPHFLPVTPGGRFVEECLVSRLRRRLGSLDLVPLHRLDRHTAGLVLFSLDPASRSHYQALFREQRMFKRYQALAAPLPDLDGPLRYRSRLAAGTPFFRMTEVPGVANSETRIKVLERHPHSWRYALYPVTGKKHQLRVHMAALGAPILGDPFYPLLSDEQPDDYGKPLCLLAECLAFVDPLQGRRHRFHSRLQLERPAADVRLPAAPGSPAAT